MVEKAIEAFGHLVMSITENIDWPSPAGKTGILVEITRASDTRPIVCHAGDADMRSKECNTIVAFILFNSS
jgi:hypothetical protein